MTLGDRLVVMKDGVVQQVDAPDRVYREPANRFVASFVGTPTMNFIEGRVAAGGRFEAAECSLPLPQNHRSTAVGPCTVGVRPDAFVLAERSEETIPCSIETVEFLGDRIDLVLNASVGRLVCRTTPRAGLAEGDRVFLRWIESGVHLFEPGSDGARRAGG